jgi:hypothetical protein
LGKIALTKESGISRIKMMQNPLSVQKFKFIDERTAISFQKLGARFFWLFWGSRFAINCSFYIWKAYQDDSDLTN